MTDYGHIPEDASPEEIARMVERADEQTHYFTVRISGCNAEQAGHVITERIQHDEDYGFDYTIDTVDAPTIHIAVWEGDAQGLNAQAYLTQEAALRDFPQADFPGLAVIESTIQP